jgi:long-chain acyl-CoA synthetase
MRNLLDLLKRAVAAASDKTAIIDDQGSVPFRGLWSAAEGVAGLLAAHALKSGRVGLLMPASAGQAAAYFGALLAGRVPVPLNLLLSPAELAFCVADADVDVVVTATPLAERATALGRPVVRLDAPGASRPVRQATGLGERPRPNDIATLLYTSGTTNRPKGVLLTHGNLLANAEACRQAMSLTDQHVLMGLLPLFHTLGLMVSLIIPVRLAATTILCSRFQPVAVAERLRRHRPTVISAVPSMYAALLASRALGPGDGSWLDLCIAGGEPLPTAVGQAFERQTGRPILEGYGLTETSPVVCVNRAGANRPGTVGPPLPGVEVRIAAPNQSTAGTSASVDAAPTPRPAGQEGEVWIHGPNVSPGYHNRPEETALAFTADGWFRTGDLGRLDADGRLTLTGRLKDLIISSGENIAPRDIEEVLLAHPAVAEAAVIGVPDRLRGEVPKAFVVQRDGQSFSAADLVAFCRKSLPNFKVPRGIEFRPVLPKGPTGKVNRRALREEQAS